MGCMAQTPLWVPVVVGALGVVGTLAASFLTLIISGRRERDRWQRERDHEDTYRNYKDRQAAYAELLTSINEFSNAVSATKAALRRGSEITVEMQLDITKALSTYAGVTNVVQLLAPIGIDRFTNPIKDVMVRVRNLVEAKNSCTDEINTIWGEMHNLWPDLIIFMRADLGVEPDAGRQAVSARSAQQRSARADRA
jgi:hypothetical protein